MPSNICQACSFKISEAYTFRQQALETNAMFFTCFENIKSTTECIETETTNDLFEIDDSKVYLDTIEESDIIEHINEPELETDEISYNAELQYINSDSSVFDPHNNLFQACEIEVIRMGTDKHEDIVNSECLEIISCDEDYKFDEKLRDKRAKSKMYRNQKKYKEVEKDRLCNVCGKSFDTGNKFRAHYRLHFPEKCYQCSYCAKYFAHKFMWVEHERIHTSERPYTCLLCDYSAKQKTSLQVNLNKYTNAFHFV